MTNRIALGIIRKAHGVRGEASVEPWTDTIGRFDQLERVTLVSPDESSTREMTVEAAREHSGRVLVKFAEIGAPEELRELQGWTIEIPESEARPLEEGEYFLHDLVGLRLVDADGGDRGVVISVSEGGGGALLTVKKASGKEFDVPFASAICTHIDLARRTITVALPEGIEDVDAAD
ncbi:MAG: ribosome maturation factor RimM [Thermoanaerobaculia bacterium]